MHFVLPFFAFLLSLGLYLKTLAPTYIPVDSAEFALCMKFWGVCHPPGFPLFITIGHFFLEFFPHGTAIFKASLLSAIFGAGTISVIFLILKKLKVNLLVAFLTPLFFAVSSTQWEFSTSADVFTFGTFLTLFSIYLLFLKRFFLAFFVLGLSASHFYITATLFPIFGWYVFTSSKFKVKSAKFYTGLFLSTAFALGFFPQAILFWRMGQNPEINWGHHVGLSGFFNFIRRKEFGSFFLLANPSLVFSPLKVLKHFYAYFLNLFSTFAVFLPLFTIASFFTKRKNEVFLLFFAFLGLLVVQLVLLSTIDPLEATSPFQINKFYLLSQSILILLSAVGLNFLADKFFRENGLYVFLLMLFAIGIYFTANYKSHDLSQNYFSQNQVLDSLEQLPKGSIAISVNHTFYFGGIYEQKVNNRFKDITLVYFPNEKNRDSEFYQKQLFSKPNDEKFIKSVSLGKNLGKAERYVLDTISKNLDREIYIAQGTFEEGFFAYLKPSLRPWGLWWKVTRQAEKVDSDASTQALTSTRNINVRPVDLFQKHQREDLASYGVAYKSLGVLLASEGKYQEADRAFSKSLEYIPNSQSTKRLREQVRETEFLTQGLLDLISSKNTQRITALGNNYFEIGNYQGCIEAFNEVILINPKDAKAFNNLASCQASLGEYEGARVNYKKALAIEPTLDLAKRGLEALDSTN